MVCDLLQKIELLHAAGTTINPEHGEEIVKTFYDILTVLDTKGLALLAFDGIVVAATTFAAERGGVFHNRGLPRWLAILIIIYLWPQLHYALESRKFLIHSSNMSTALLANLISPRRSAALPFWLIGAPHIIK